MAGGTIRTVSAPTANISGGYPERAPVAIGGVLEAARTYDLSAFDAAYLHLAAVRALPLATVDARLRAACAQAGVEVLG